MDIDRLANRGALKTKLYVPGKSRKEVEKELHISGTIKMASNENPHGSSPQALRALEAVSRELYMYPDPVSTDLRERIAASLGCDRNEVSVGNGADGVIYNLAMAVIDQDDEVIIPEITFPVYETVTQVMRGVPVRSAMRELSIDLADIERKIGDRTKALFLCNPNNPTGDALPRDEFLEFLRAVPGRILVVLDEAYIEFTDPALRPDSVRLFREGMDNLFILRTFSKIYGLAGLRIGYGIGDAGLVTLMNRVKPPFDVSVPAESAAILALSDGEFVRSTLEDAAREKAFFYRELQRRNLDYVASHTNFVLIDTGRQATDLFRRLLRRGVIVRPAKTYGLPTSIRVTLGRHEENERFFQALDEVLAEMKDSRGIPGEETDHG